MGLRRRAPDVTFTVPIEEDGAFPTYLTVPDPAELLGTRRAVEVTSTTDGHPFAATLMPSGDGPHRLPLRAGICTAIGKSRVGEESTVHLQQRPT